MSTFLVSDTHWGHQGMVKFLREDGSKLRPWETTDEMDEAMIDNWNKVVGPKDKVYHLGDVVINRKALKTLARLNGDKVLIKGNHDIFRLEEYTPYFRDIRGFGHFDGFALTHIPIHPDSLSRWTGNIHGHLHANRVMRESAVTINGLGHIISSFQVDKRYLCVSMEHINYTPIAWENCKKRFEEQQ